MEIYNARKNTKLLIIAFFFISFSWAKQIKNSTIAQFIKELEVISLPFTTTSLSNAKIVSNEFFYYEKENNYYELQDLRCLGYFKKENIIYLLYSFNLVGEGEGFANDMIILSSFHTSGKHLEDIELQGTYGGEGGAYIYEKAVVDEKKIVVDIRDEHYESDTGLGYSIVEYKKYIYKFEGKYNLEEKTYRCNQLKNLTTYYSQLEKGYENKDDSIYGLSYLLENYLHCFPVDQSNIKIYKRIWNFLKKSVDNKSVALLLEEIEKIAPTNAIFMVSVNNLRLREAPGLKATKIELLPIHSEVVYLQEKSNYKQEVSINNRKLFDYWYKVKTTTGKVGWLHGCCVNPF